MQNPRWRRSLFSASSHSPVTNVDLTAADALDALATRLAAVGVEFCVAEMKGPVKDHLRRLGLYDRLGAERFHRSIEQAVGAYLALHPEARVPALSSGGSSTPNFAAADAR
ncbi:MAG: STAS domain-containing protein [Gammaproteobacteria bacterium]